MGCRSLIFYYINEITFAHLQLRIKTFGRFNKQIQYMETLIKNKEEFVDLLNKQIAKGHELLNLDIPVSVHSYNHFGRPKEIYEENDEKTFMSSYKKWDDFNKEIYKQSFNNQDNSYLKSYCKHENTLWGLDIIKELKEIISAKVTQMEGDVEKSPLIPCKSSKPSTSNMSTFSASKDVFIVHGHDSVVLKDVENFVRKIGLNPIILRDMPSTGKTIIEKIEKYTGNVCYAIVLYTPCDEGKAKEDTDYKFRARQNVVFEHGYLCGKLTRSHVCALVKGDVEVPGDLSGVVYVTITEKWEFDVAKEMKAVGIDININNLI